MSIVYHLNLNVTQLLGVQVPQLFHSASIWLTLVLAAQRYISVCRPAAAQRWCTVAKVDK